MVVIPGRAGWPQLAAASELSIVRTAEPAFPTADTKSLTAKARWYKSDLTAAPALIES